MKTKIEIPQDLQDKLQAELKNFATEYDLMLSILNKIHLATDEIMEQIPLYALYLLLSIAKEKKMDKAIEMLEREIILNLEQRERTRKAELLAERMRMLRLSIENRLNALN